MWSDLSGDQYLIKTHFCCPGASIFDVSLGLTGWFSLLKCTVLPVIMIDSILIPYSEMCRKCKYDGKAHIYGEWQ